MQASRESAGVLSSTIVTGSGTNLYEYSGSPTGAMVTTGVGVGPSSSQKDDCCQSTDERQDGNFIVGKVHKAKTRSTMEQSSATRVPVFDRFKNEADGKHDCWTPWEQR